MVYNTLYVEEKERVYKTKKLIKSNKSETLRDKNNATHRKYKRI